MTFRLWQWFFFILQKDEGIWSVGPNYSEVGFKALVGLLGPVRVQVNGNGEHSVCICLHRWVRLYCCHRISA